MIVISVIGQFGFENVKLPVVESKVSRPGGYYKLSASIYAMTSVDSGPQTVLMIIPVRVTTSSFTPSVVTTSISTSKLVLTDASVLKVKMPVAESNDNCS
jgi:hypothetical protein